jgi:hypothetical protein
MVPRDEANTRVLTADINQRWLRMKKRKGSVSGSQEPIAIESNSSRRNSKVDLTLPPPDGQTSGTGQLMSMTNMELGAGKWIVSRPL